MATITTAVTQLTDDGPLYRGDPATELATSASYEEVAALLWGGAAAGPAAGSAPGAWEPAGLGPALRSLGGPACAGRWSWPGGSDPLRADLRPAAVVRAARRIVASMIAVARTARRRWPASTTGAPAGPRRRTGSSTARSPGGWPAPASPRPRTTRSGPATPPWCCWPTTSWPPRRWRCGWPRRPAPTSTTRCSPGWAPSPARCTAGRAAWSTACWSTRPPTGSSAALATPCGSAGMLPGFGHVGLRLGGRPLRGAGRSLRAAGHAGAAGAGALAGRSRCRGTISRRPTSTSALAAVAWAAGLGPDAGQTLFTVARVAGWVAHYLEELDEPPLRYRARAVYSLSGRA